VKRGETLLGLLLLALVLAGLFWTRARGGTGAAGTGEGLPDLSHADAVADLGAVRLRLAVTPRPITAFAAHRWEVTAEAGGAPVPLTAGRISFAMRMPMGDHDYSLEPTPDGGGAAEVVLPRCASGERRWIATVEATVAGELHRARFRFDLEPPAPAP